MHLNIQALHRALDEANIAHGAIPGFEDSVATDQGAFLYAATPFNAESVAALCHDKAATHALLEGAVSMPRTAAFLDPEGPRPELAVQKSVEDIVRASASFAYPRMVKMNRGERAKNVYFVESDEECRNALRTIFDKRSADYDFMALMQEYIEPERELRVAISAGKPIFAYDRRTFKVVDEATAAQLFEPAVEAGRILRISWGAVDFIESKSGGFYFIEANSRPSYEGFIRANGDDRICDLFRRALADIAQKSAR